MNLNVKGYFKTMKIIHEKILDFIENDDDSEENSQNLINYCNEQNIAQNYNIFKSTLYILKNITNHHYRNQNFFPKIYKILQNFKDPIKQTFSNYEIFNIFKSNKLVVLFLIENEFITPDKSIAFMLTKSKYKKRFYPQFFYPEFKGLFNNKTLKEIDPEKNDYESESFKKKRLIGENDDRLCQLIRNDSIDEFKKEIATKIEKFTIQIKPSIFETNIFLNDEQVNILDYAAFFGSIEIFKYIKSEGIEILCSSAWNCSIHGQKIELIRLIEESKIPMTNEIYKSCLNETVKCHHIEIMNYFKTNFDKIQISLLEQSMKHYNFIELSMYKNPENFNFYRYCEYDYYILIENYLNKHNGRTSIFSMKDDEIIF